MLKFVMYILYKYYSKGGTKEISYFSALCVVVLLIYIHFFQILILFNQVDAVLPMNRNDDRPVKYLKLAIFLLPVFLIISLLVKPKDLKNSSYDERKVKRGGFYLVIYSITSFILLFVLAFLKRN
ncbi:MAG: hypothetical protein J0G98_19440 [Terrimonas ferruginea]|uniref:hypothetical protein n=1 Tax=Terrimonas ferruginea TaxID=249 RepID=UPI0009260CD5|nr:hypothetical protein [Terrimonas ferruginea]MBN8785242.1 hypothetical protein [Terrimonas ferruginea]OJW45477.1 MAG: hypothetical protein BGO56_02000 [Sphingobacteriales bacterium 48-107]